MPRRAKLHLKQARMAVIASETGNLFPATRRNRGHYRNPRIDTLTDQIRVEMDLDKRKALCGEVQKILADDLPYLPMWFTGAVSVHRRELGDLQLSPTGDYDFLA